MKVNIRLFASCREAVGTGQMVLDAESDATVNDIWSTLTAKFPAMTKFSGQLGVAVNAHYTSWDRKIEEGDEIVFIPPVSGG